MHTFFLSKEDYLKTRSKYNDGVHICIAKNKESIDRLLKKLGANVSVEIALGNVTICNGLPFVFFVINSDKWFLDIKKCCDELHSHMVSKGAINKFYIHVDGLRYMVKRALLLTLFKSIFQFKKYISNRTKKQSRVIAIVDYRDNKKSIAEIIQHINAGNISRSIATEPSNKMHPQAFCSHVHKLFKNQDDIKVREFSMQDLKNLDLNLIVSVGKGAHHEPRMIVIEYKTKHKDADTICIAGKGVVFDSGGYNMKPSSSMWGMKGDKTGGAVVVGIFEYLKKMKVKPDVNIIGVIPLVENLVSHASVKPGDIIKTYNGKTVEIVDTDAEGRLILADAMAYVCDKYNPKYIIDFATLTGWAELMHCDTSYVFYTQNDEAASVIQYIGDYVGERSVRMPKWPEYIEYTKSSVADFMNIDTKLCKRSGGFMASMFLMNFIPEELRKRWIHFDITHSEAGSLHNCNSLATGIDFVFKYLAKQ